MDGSRFANNPGRDVFQPATSPVGVLKISGSSLPGGGFFNGVNFVMRAGNMAVNAAPTTGTWERGEQLWNSEPSAGGPSLWICYTAGTPGDWAGINQLGYRSGGASPSGVVTPLMADEEWLDSVGNIWYKAYGLANTNWRALN